MIGIVGDIDKDDSSSATGGRIISIDVLRGLTILLMVYVNDLGHGAPSWMHHIKPSNADGMTLADIVFPFFLFIVGVSIPLALKRARDAGMSTSARVLHILTRTAGLLLMGVIELNSEHDRTLGEPLWGLLAFIAIIWAWSAIPPVEGMRRTVLMVLKALGIIGLVVLLAIYRREARGTEILFWGPVEGWVWLQAGWWGILGLIGWAYLTVAILTLLLGRRREWLMGALAILIIIHLAFHNGGLFTRVSNKPWLGALAGVFEVVSRGIEQFGKYVSLDDATGSLAAITMAGCLLGTILLDNSGLPTHRARISWALTFVVGLVLAGFVTDTFEGINKIGATPTWCLWSAALACFVWILLYLLIDVAGFRVFSIFIRPTGSNALVAYFLHPIIIFLISLAGLESSVLAYKESSNSWVVMGGSLGMALFVCVATSLLTRLGLRVRL